MLSVFEIFISAVCFIVMCLIGIGGLVCLFAPIPPGISTIELDEGMRWRLEKEGMSEEEIDEILYGDK